MKCPSCSVDLLMTQRENVEIDYCPKCRGVWLDRGELDKIIDRVAAEAPRGAGREDRDDDDRLVSARWDDGDPRRHGPQRRKRSLLGNFFDFD